MIETNQAEALRSAVLTATNGAQPVSTSITGGHGWIGGWTGSIATGYTAPSAVGNYTATMTWTLVSG